MQRTKPVREHRDAHCEINRRLVFHTTQANKTAVLELPEGNARAAREAITLPDTYADIDLFGGSADFSSFAECAPATSVRRTP